VKKYQRAIVAFFLYFLLSAFLSLPNSAPFIMFIGLVHTIFIFVIPDNFFKDDDVNKVLFLKSGVSTEVKDDIELRHALDEVERLRNELSAKTHELNNQRSLTNIMKDKFHEKLDFASSNLNRERKLVQLLQQRLVDAEKKNKKLLSLLKQKTD
jgi:hypothetical protein